mgnify:CR=1 FL=1
MRRVLLFLFVLIGLSATAKADTIDFYWVFYNDTVWAKLNGVMNNTELHLNGTGIKADDSITIKYTTDTPCPGCHHTLAVKDENGNKIEELDKNGSWVPFTFSIRKFSHSYKPPSSYSFYYDGRLLFKLLIE